MSRRGDGEKSIVRHLLPPAIHNYLKHEENEKNVIKVQQKNIAESFQLHFFL